jgi:hypothetical protein
MSNHFHMIIETPKGNLSEIMRHFNIRYTAAFNRRHNRLGHRYQGRFKSIYKEFVIDGIRHGYVTPWESVTDSGSLEPEKPPSSPASSEGQPGWCHILTRILAL